MSAVANWFPAINASSSRNRPLRRVVRGRQGSAIVEMAFGIPILFMILTGIFFISIALFQKLQLAEAISVGGRYLAVDRGDTDPCASAASKIYAAAPGLAKSNLTLNFNINGVATGATCPGSGGTANANMVSGSNASISASYPCSLRILGAYGSSPSTACNVKAAVVEIVQ